MKRRKVAALKKHHPEIVAATFVSGSGFLKMVRQSLAMV